MDIDLLFVRPNTLENLHSTCIRQASSFAILGMTL